MKETRKYVFQSLSELNRVTLPGNKDHDSSGVIGQMDRSEFVSFLSSLLRIDPSSRITPQQALQKPFITMYHLAAHSSSPEYVSIHCVTIVMNVVYCLLFVYIHCNHDDKCCLHCNHGDDCLHYTVYKRV